jgi:predicted transglutaminase-like cysteine proteinase
MNLLNTLTGGYASLILYAIAAAAIAAVLAYTYHAGASNKDAQWQLKYDQREVQITEAYNAEVSRQAQANAMAKALEAKRLDDLEKANAALNKKIKELSDEADADPDRDRVCLSDGSRLRIDSIH